MSMTPKFLPVLQMCIDNGIAIGINRAYKHTDEPTRESIQENIHREIMNEIYEWFDFKENEDDSGS